MMKSNKKNDVFRFSSYFSLAVLFVLMLVSSCITEPPKGSKAAQALRGKKIFAEQCATCHGMGEVVADSSNLDLKAPDLTQIMSRRRVTEFPIGEVAMFIDGRQLVAAHGPREMPVWGEVYKTEGMDEAQIKGRKGELVAYLMSIQK